MNRSCLWVFYLKSDKWSVAAWQQLKSNLKLHPSLALSLSTLNRPCGIHGDAVAALVLCQTLWRTFHRFSATCRFVFVLAKAVDPVEAEFFVREAQVSNPRLGSSTARARVDYGVADAAILQPSSFTPVQELELPRCVQLTHFGHLWTVPNACLHRLRIIHLLKAFEEVHFACGDAYKERGWCCENKWKGEGKQSRCIVQEVKGEVSERVKPQRRAWGYILSVSLASVPDCVQNIKSFQQLPGQQHKIESR